MQTVVVVMVVILESVVIVVAMMGVVVIQKTAAQSNSLFLFTLPSTTILISILILVFDYLQTPSTKKYPILYFLESTTIENLFGFITIITILSSDPHSSNIV